MLCLHDLWSLFTVALAGVCAHTQPWECSAELSRLQGRVCFGLCVRRLLLWSAVLCLFRYEVLRSQDMLCAVLCVQYRGMPWRVVLCAAQMWLRCLLGCGALC